MENSEQNRKSLPGRSTTRRNLFSSIINFSVSQGVKVNGVGNFAAPQHQHIPDKNTRSKEEPSEVSKTERNGEVFTTASVASNFSNSSVAESNHRGNHNSLLINSPLGQGPKTFSVLAALSELEISKEQLNNHHHRHSLSTGTLASSVSSFTGSAPATAAEVKPLESLTNEFGSKSTGKGMRQVSNGYPGARKAYTLNPCAKPKSLPEKHISVPPDKSSRTKTRRSKSKERTPDWIWKIFQLAKQGRQVELKTALVGLDPTLIRHLADAKGNTLLHCAARGGHLQTLQWLVSILSSQMEAALNDQNRAGRTVILTTLKSGQLDCLQWMVLHTSFGDKALVPTEGKWSLLHFASKYGNEGAVRWLCEQLLERQVRIDLRDSAGMTPLHVAAKSGRIGISQELIRAGADPLCQTELGWRPSDFAFRHHHVECANYFIMAEAAGSLGKELHSLLMDFTTLRQHQEILRTHFREVLRVGKWLMKERGYLIKKFASPNASGGGGTNPSSSQAGLLLGGAMSGNGVRLSELEHSLVLAEQGWRKVESNRIDGGITFPFTGRDNDEGLQIKDLLQTRLFASHVRQDKNVASGAIMSTSSDDESSVSSATSGDEEYSADHRLSLKSCLRTPTRQSRSSYDGTSSSNTNIVSGSPFRSTNTPWLLGFDDSILSTLSPSRNPNNNNVATNNTHNTSTNNGQHLPNLDLFRVASTNTFLLPRIGPPGKKSSSSENSPGLLRSKVYGTSEGRQTSNPISSSAAVLEVIEPLHSTTKQTGNQSSILNKSALRESSLSKTPSPVYSGSPSFLDSSLSSAIENERQFTCSSRMRRRIKFNSRDEESEGQLSPSYSARLKNEIEEIYAAPDLIRGTHHLGGRNVVGEIGRKDPSLGETTSGVQSNTSGGGLDEIFEMNHFSTFHSRKSHSTDGSLAVGPKGGNFSRARISSTLSVPTTTSEYLSTSEAITVPSDDLEHEFFLDVLEPCGGDMGRVPLFPEQQSNSILPPTSPYVSVSPSSAKKNYGASLTILPLESTDLVLFPIQQQLQLPFQLSENGIQVGGEMTSPVTVVHLPNDSSSSSDPPIMPRSHSSVSLSSTVVFPISYGKSTWTPAEEPSEEAQCHYLSARLSPTLSETSRTESALALPPSHMSEASKTESFHGHQLEGSSRSRLSLGEEGKEEEDEDDSLRESHEKEDKRGLERVLKMRRDDKADDGDSDKSCLGSPRKVQTPCIIRQRLSTPSTIHKTSIHHRVKKSSRRPSKPWYEIEGSDDEGSLLQVARARSRSTCLSSSSLSPAEESGSEELSYCDEGDGHECDSTSCSRHNCPDFV